MSFSYLTNIATTSTHQLFWIESVSSSSIKITPRLSFKIGLATLETHIVGVSVHGKP